MTLQRDKQADPFPNLTAALLACDPACFPASVVPEVGTFLYAFIRLVKPSVIVEIGSHRGMSTLYFSQALHDIGAGQIECFDLFCEQISPTTVAPEAHTTYEQIQAHLRHAGLAEWARLHPGDSSTTLAGMAQELHDRVDVAFIDGDHTIRGCLKDWYAVDRVLKPGGFVLLHDTQPRSRWLGPAFLVRELPAYSAQYQLIDLPTPDMAGLAIIRKLSGAPAPVQPINLIDRICQRVFHWNISRHSERASS